MKKDPDLKFEVGDRVKSVLRSGKIEEGVVRAIIQTTKGAVLNVSFGPKLDLAPLHLRFGTVPTGTYSIPLIGKRSPFRQCLTNSGVAQLDGWLENSDSRRP
jgi:hypothetical protein